MDKARLTATTLAALATTLFLAGCGGPNEVANGSAAPTDAPADDANVAPQPSTADGQSIAISSDPDARVTLPDGFDLIPGASVKSNTKMQMGAGNASIVSFEVDAAPEDVVEYYREQAVLAGFEIKSEATANATHAIAGEAGRGDGFQLSVEPKGEGSKATLMVGRGMGE